MSEFQFHGPNHYRSSKELFDTGEITAHVTNRAAHAELSTPQRERLMHDTEQWLNLSPDTALLYVEYDKDKAYIDGGGRLVGPPTFAHDGYDWVFRFPVYNDKKENGYHRVLNVPLDAAISRCKQDQLSHFIIGEEAIAQFVDIRPQHYLTPHAYNMAVSRLRNLAIDFNGMGLDDDEKSAACNMLVQALVIPDREFFNGDAIKNIAYISDMAEHHTAGFNDILYDELATTLPLRSADIEYGISRIVQNASEIGLETGFQDSSTEPLSRFKVHDRYILRCQFMSELYRRRSAQASDTQQPVPTNIPAVAPQNMRPLHIFHSENVSDKKINDDIDLLLFMRQEGVAVDALNRDEGVMRRGVRQIFKWVIDRPAHQHPQGFAALEYMFDLHHPSAEPQREHLYELLRKRTAQYIPIAMNGDSYRTYDKRMWQFVESLANAMPASSCGPDQPPVGSDKRLAHVLSELYNDRAQLLIARRAAKSQNQRAPRSIAYGEANLTLGVNNILFTRSL